MQLNRWWLTPKENYNKVTSIGMFGIWQGLQANTVKQGNGRQRNGRDLSGNLLARHLVPEPAPNQPSPTCGPLISAPDVLQHEAPFHLLFWGPTCSFPHTAGLFGPEEQAKFPSSAISHGCASIIDTTLKNSVWLQHHDELGLSELEKTNKTHSEWIYNGSR